MVAKNVIVTEHKRHIISDKDHLSCRYEHTDYPYMHTHNYWEFMLVTKGAMLHKINGKIQTLEAGHLCMIRPSDSHMIKKISSETTHINFIVSEANMHQQLRIVDPKIKRKIIKEPYILLKLSSRSTSQYTTGALNIQSMDSSHPNYRLQLGRMFLTFMLDIIRFISVPAKERAIKAPVAVLDIIAAINNEENIHKPLTELTKKSGYSYVHLSRMFKEHMHMTLKDYLISVRMNYARLLLENSDKNILNISSQIGYNSISHFNHTFKGKYHMTPSEYRKNWQEFYGSFEDV